MSRKGRHSTGLRWRGWRKPRGLPRQARGMSIVECVFSVVLVGGLVVVALHTVGASTVAQQTLSNQAQGELLAAALLSEILTQEYEDPDHENAVFGLEATENPSLRTTFDDVDDYAGFNAAPPQHRNGTPIAGLTGWAQRVQVEVVDAVDLTTKRLTDTGVKKVTVTITRNNLVTAKLVGIKTGPPNLSLVIPL